MLLEVSAQKESQSEDLGQCRPLIKKPLLLNEDYKRDPNMKALERSGFINQGSTLLRLLLDVFH